MAETAMKRGLAAIQDGRPDAEIYEAFRLAYAGDDQNPTILSYYGLYRATCENDIVGGLHLAKQALQMDYLRSDYYHNIGKIFLKLGCRGQAIAFFYKGLKVDPGDREIRRTLENLGRRRKPALPFLKRHNLLNKFLGRLSWKLKASPPAVSDVPPAPIADAGAASEGTSPS